MVWQFLGKFFYVGLLLVNAVAVLSEDRFLARIGWSSSTRQNQNAGFQQPYDQSSYGVNQQEPGIKDRMIDLIAAVRTLLRIPLIAINIIVIIYELILGG
ncbi:Yos1-like protein [Fistulina hepatica ATCC 64428]|nr:Yos1-like protein [Fistulina hepatica ATCC 64428]